MQRCLVFFLLNFYFLFSAPGDLFNGADDSVMVHNVNVITGQLQLSFVDHIVEGSASLVLRRSYTNSGTEQDTISKWQFAGGWTFFSHAHLYLDLDTVNHKYWGKISEYAGGLISYEEESKTSSLIVMKPYVDETQNLEVMSYRSNPKNNRLHLDRVNKKAILYLSNGGKRIYGRFKRSIGWLENFKGYYKGLGSEYLLEEEVSPSGQRTLYEYSKDKKTLCVKAVNRSGTKVFSQILLEGIKDSAKTNIKATTSDGIIVNYFSKAKYGHLRSISSNIRPEEKITYYKPKNLNPPWLETITLKGKNPLKVEYYFSERKQYFPKQITNTNLEKCNKVKRIFEGGENRASFSYDEKVTNVLDVNNLLTKYHYENSALFKIERFDKNNTLYSEERFIWEGGNLIAKEYLDGQGNLLFSKSFKYDEFKNLIEEKVSGKLGESYTKWYKYDKNHLPIEEREESGVVYYFQYLDGTDLIISKRCMDGDTLLLKESFIYDENFLLVEKRVFDGRAKTYEKWQRDGETGLVIKTSNGLIENFYEYDKNKNLIKEGNLFNQILFTYDEKGRMDGECYSSGEKNSYKFNVYGSPVEIKEIGSGKKFVKYNTHNLPILCRMNGKHCQNFYDNKGRIVKEKISSGAETCFTYDEFGRMIKKTLPQVLDENGEPYFPEIFYEYDTSGNVICETSPSGATTRSEYNLFKKPIKTIFPDGSTIFNSYYSNGELKESIDKDGAKTTYIYDGLNRLILKKSELFEERWEYDGRVLRSYTDPSGLVTIYEYDEFLRKIAEDCEGRKKEFFYDQMGYICLTKCGELFNTEVHDTQGRVIETTQNGFNKISYEYDKEGRKIKAIKHTENGDATDLFFWDEEGVLIKHIDPLGGVTAFVYDGNRRIEIDPTGNRSIEVFDALKRVVRKEKRSKDGELVFAENFFYDRGGNLKRRFTEEHDLEVEYDYDNMGRVILETESGVKTTSFSYDIKGRISSKITPNGVVLEYRYDSADRMIELKATDNSVWYEYEYTGIDLTKIKDLILDKTLEQKYTKFHEVIEETGFSGFKTSWYYDYYGRKKEVHLPDGSSIFYSYKGGCISKVSRFDRDKKLLYEHCYTKFDLNHHVKEEKLPFHFGIAKTSRDFMQRPISLETPFHNIGLCFNLANLITKKINSLFCDKDYAYDSLNQLTKEGDTDYAFDSLGNSKEYEINKLNQIVSKDSEEFCYDSNGNLIKHNDSVYTYDALNRLIKIVHQHRKVIYFTYDPLSRLVSKNNDYYLYDGECEIGKINKDGEILELKVLGLGVKGEIGGAIMLEFGGRHFIPLHDLQGNMIALLSRVQNIVETYDFNAFGQTKRTIYLNPWRFCSKREEEGLLFFGKRFYDPKLKRWLSPDPLGFKDSRNLYQFVLNDPLNRLDEFGLEVDLYFHTDHYNTYKEYEHKLPYSMDQYRSSIFDLPTSVEHRGAANVFGQTMHVSMICSRRYSFNFTDEEKSLGYFNIFSHIPELLEGAENQIAIVSYMNGMNCPILDWQSMNHSIAGDLPQGAFFIGLYNQTNGLYSDSKRVWKEKWGTPMVSAYNLSRYFMEMKKHMSATCPNAKILHICHSEGGAIYNLAFKLLSEDDQAWVRKHVHVLAFGPLECIPKDHGLDPINFYSKNDLITGWFAETDLEKYNVEWLNVTYGLVNKVRETFPAHEFGGKVYQQALNDRINKFKSTVGFYVGHKR